MPRRSKGPWRRKSDDCYYTTVNDKQVKLTEPEVACASPITYDF